MLRPLVVDPRAEKEIDKAYGWYKKRNADAALRFRGEVEQAMRTIQERTASLPSYLRGSRRCLLNKFPYLVVFREYADHLFIIAVAHGHQRPGYWFKRLK